MPFVDPVTRLKVKINPKACLRILSARYTSRLLIYIFGQSQVIEDGLFEPSMIFTKSWGGAINFEYDHAQYWPKLVGMSDTSRAEQMARWKELGGTVGLEEWIIKGGPDRSIGV